MLNRGREKENKLRRKTKGVNREKNGGRSKGGAKGGKEKVKIKRRGKKGENT